MFEVIVYKVLDVVFDKLASEGISKIAQMLSVGEDFEKLKRTLSIIQVVLKDAETRQVKEEALKIWLRELKDLAYDADDVLDDFAYEAEKVSDLFSYKVNISFREKFGRRIKEINKRLDEIAEERSKFHLKVGVVGSLKIESSTIREEIGFHIDESEVYGRQRDKEKIVEILLNTSIGGDVGVICIVGLGGLGKTTLAQLVYQDERVCRHFEKRMSVCMSKEFAIGINDEMQASLRQQLGNRRFLLVLDDVWSESQKKWDRLKKLLRVGAKGSRVIVTTRSERVASIMGTIPPYQLSILSLDDCWLLFERRAFGNGVERNPNLVERNPNLDSIGKEIVKKCGGSPLAAEALGSLLRFKRSESEWQAIKDSELWKFPENENCEILPVLKLSYDHLSPCLKQCFAYCSIFPKDYDIETKILVNLWGAEGFLNPYNEQIGLQYVDELLASSLFQKNKEGYVKMHDLVHDLARSVAGNECSIVDAAKGGHLSQNSRYASFINNNFESLSIAPQSLHDAKKLRTLYLCDPRVDFSLEEEKTEEEKQQRVQKDVQFISSKLTFLRALHLNRYPLKALPDSFNNLMHLRYLDLSHTLIQSLPESICNLSNLHTLNLRSCSSIHELPQNMSNMKSLVHLDIGGCNELTCIPRGLGKLNLLRTLPIFIVGEETNCSLEELGSMKLEGELHIKRLQNVWNIDEAKVANLSDKHSIKSLTLSWEYFIFYDVKIAEDVLQFLQPSKSLEALEINGYLGRTFPFWMMESSLSNLDRLTLSDCCNCERIPVAFPSLKNLYLDNLTGLEELCSVGSEQLFPCLEVLSLIKCPKLKALPSVVNAFPSLQELELRDMTGLKEWCSVGSEQLFPCLEKLVLDNCPKLKALPSVFNAFPSLKKLELRDLTGLEEWSSVGSEQLFPCLEKLALINCPELKALPSFVNAFPSLKELELRNLTGLEEWSSVGSEQLFPCIEELALINCPKLKALPSVSNAFPSLKKLELRDLTGLEEWFSVGSEQLFPCLETLALINCPELKELPSDFSSVKAVRSRNCGCLSDKGGSDDDRRVKTRRLKY